MSHSGNDLQACAMLGVVGTILLWKGIKKFQKRRRYEDVPEVPIHSAPQGLVELGGFAWSKALLFNLSGNPIAYAFWKLEKYVQSGKNSSWVEVAKGGAGDGFLLHDQTGAVWVNMQGADLDAPNTHLLWNKIDSTSQARFLSWMEYCKISVTQFPPSNSFFSSSFRVVLQEIAIGCPITAQGSLSTLRKESIEVLAGINDFKERYIKLNQNKAYALSMMDINNDGVISEEENRTGFVMLATTAARKVANGGTSGASVSYEAAELFGTLCGTETAKLLVASTEENYIVEDLKRWTWAMIIGGASLIALSICLLKAQIMR